MTPTLILPRSARQGIEGAARAAWPAECCGLLEGFRAGSTFVVTAAHAVRNIAADAGRFELDPAGHFAVQRALRGTGRAVIGCYHSHPNGRPQPSQRDGEGASEAGYVWLIAALAAQDVVRIAAYLFDGAGFAPISVVDTASLDPARPPRV